MVVSEGDTSFKPAYSDATGRRVRTGYDWHSEHQVESEHRYSIKALWDDLTLPRKLSIKQCFVQKLGEPQHYWPDSRRPIYPLIDFLSPRSMLEYKLLRYTIALVLECTLHRLRSLDVEPDMPEFPWLRDASWSKQHQLKYTFWAGRTVITGSESPAIGPEAQNWMRDSSGLFYLRIDVRDARQSAAETCSTSGHVRLAVALAQADHPSFEQSSDYRSRWEMPSTDSEQSVIMDFYPAWLAAPDIGLVASNVKLAAIPDGPALCAPLLPGHPDPFSNLPHRSLIAID